MDTIDARIVIVTAEINLASIITGQNTSAGAASTQSRTISGAVDARKLALQDTDAVIANNIAVSTDGTCTAAAL